MCVYICMYIYVYTYVCIYIYKYTHSFSHTVFYKCHLGQLVDSVGELFYILDHFLPTCSLIVERGTLKSLTLKMLFKIYFFFQFSQF